MRPAVKSSLKCVPLKNQPEGLSTCRFLPASRKRSVHLSVPAGFSQKVCPPVGSCQDCGQPLQNSQEVCPFVVALFVLARMSNAHGQEVCPIVDSCRSCRSPRPLNSSQKACPLVAKLPSTAREKPARRSVRLLEVAGSFPSVVNTVCSAVGAGAKGLSTCLRVHMLAACFQMLVCCLAFLLGKPLHFNVAIFDGCVYKVY